MILIYEIKKLLKNKYLILMMMILMMVNILYIISGFNIDADYYIDADQKIYNQIKGELSQEKWDYIYSNYTILSKKISDGQYKSDGNDSNTISGYAMTDYLIFKYYFDKASYILNYDKYSQEISEQAINNVSFFENKGLTLSAKENKAISKLFSNRKINDLYDSSGFEAYFDYDFSMVVVIILGIYVSINILQIEQESEMININRLSRHGNRKLFFSKICCINIFMIFFVILFRLLDFVILCTKYRFDGLLQPIYSIEKYKNTGLNINIVELVGLDIMLKVLGSFMFALISFMIMTSINKAVLSLIISIGIFSVAIRIQMIFNFNINLLSIMTTKSLYKLSFVEVIGYPIEKLYIEVVFAIILIFLMIIMCLIFKKAGAANVRSRIKKIIC